MPPSPPPPSPPPPPPSPPQVALDEPPDGSTVGGLTVSFAWHVENATPGWTYNFVLLLDKGSGACDGNIEESHSGGTGNSGGSVSVELERIRYAGQSVEWGIRTTDPLSGTLCTDGFRFHVPL